MKHKFESSTLKSIIKAVSVAMMLFLMGPVSGMSAFAEESPKTAGEESAASNEVVVLGDIAVRKAGEADTAFDTEHSAVYEVEAGETIDLALTLNTTQIKQQMHDYYKSYHDLAIKNDPNANPGAALLHETSSQFVATVTFPETMDISKLDDPKALDAIKKANLTYYDPNDGSYTHAYTDTSHAVIDSNYKLDQCGKFNISDVSLDQSTRTMTITMKLDTTKLNYPDSQDPYAYGHLVCLYEAVENTPDYLSVIVPGIKMKDDYTGEQTTISGTVRGSFNTWVGGGRYFYTWRGQHVEFNWNGIQDTSINGGTDFAVRKDAITLTVQSPTPTPTPTPTPSATPTPTPSATPTPTPSTKPTSTPTSSSNPKPVPTAAAKNLAPNTGNVTHTWRNGITLAGSIFCAVFTALILRRH